MIDEMTVNNRSIKEYNARLLNFSVGGTERSYSQSSAFTPIKSATVPPFFFASSIGVLILTNSNRQLPKGSPAEPLFYFAYSTALVSRITLTLITPG